MRVNGDTVKQHIVEHEILGIQNEWDVVGGKLVPVAVRDVAINTDTLYVDTTNGRVGIGLNNPAYDLDILSTGTGFHVSGGSVQAIFKRTATGQTMSIQTGNLNSIGAAPAMTSNSNMYWYTTASTSLIFGANTNAAMLIGGVNRNIGVGMLTEPTAKFHITGEADTQQLIVQAHSTQTSPLIVAQDSSGSELFRIDSKGTGNLFTGRNSGKTSAGTYNTSFGYNSLAGSPFTGGWNAAFGANTLSANSSGYNNTAIGAYALHRNTTGYNNMALGFYSLVYNTEGISNIGIGFYSLLRNTTGDRNIAIGENSLRDNTTVNDLVAIGTQALLSNTTGTANLAIGSYALDANTTGAGNTGIGYNALSNANNNYNTAIGYNAMYSLTSGFENTAVGWEALKETTTGQYNLAIGGVALRDNTEGNNNIAVGQGALLENETGENNIAIGRTALRYNTTGGGNVAIGYSAGSAETGSNKLYIANSNTSTPLIYGLFTGTGAGLTIHSQATDGVPLIVKGIASQASNLREYQNSSGTVLSGVDERGILFSDGGVGTTNFFAGDGAGNAAGSAPSRNVGIGQDALKLVQTGANDNVIVGDRSGDAITTGSRNVGIGEFVLSTLTTGDSNTAIGTQAGGNLGGAYTQNIFFGNYAGFRQTAVSNTLLVGNQLYADAATELTNSILYGVMAATPADQTLRINAVVTISEALKLPNIKSGEDQADAGASADEVWKTASHATLPDNVLMVGV